MFHRSHRSNMSQMSRVRCIHNVAEGPSVNILVDGKIVLSQVPYKAVSDYLRVPSGKHALAITTIDGINVLASSVVNLMPGKDYSVIAHGDVKNLKSIGLLALVDSKTCPGHGKSHIRFVHAAATIPNVDIWINGKYKVFPNVAYGSVGNPTYLSVNSVKMNISAAPAGTMDIALGPIPFSPESGKIYTIIATGLLNDSAAPLSVIVIPDRC